MDGSYALRCDVWVICVCIAVCIVVFFIGIDVWFWGKSFFGGSASLQD